MRKSTLLLALFLLATATQLFAVSDEPAFKRGDVIFEYKFSSPFIPAPSYELWVDAGGPSAGPFGSLLIYLAPPLKGSPGHFLAPSADRIVLHDLRTVSIWDGQFHLMNELENGTSDVFSSDADLGEIAPMRNGNFLVPQRTAGAGPTPLLFQFNGQHIVRQYGLPGADHIELLADQCTVLFTDGTRTPRVGRINICTNTVLGDFAALTPGQYAGSIRQLPSGDILVANGDRVQQFTDHGGLIRSYPFPGVTRIALSTDGKAFYAASVLNGTAELRRYDLATSQYVTIPLGNPGMTSSEVPLEANDLVTVGEWRAAVAGSVKRFRAVKP